MSEFEDQINQEVEIANWDNEGGALVPPSIVPRNGRKNMFICLSVLVALPLIYLYAVKKND